MVRSFSDALLDVVRVLNASGQRYAISGGVAKAVYGAPRFTKDVDVLILADAQTLGSMFSPTFRYLADDTYEDSSGFVVDLYPARTELENEMLDRSREAQLGTERVRVLDPTDWAGLKLAEARKAPVEAARHLADVHEVARIEVLDTGRLAQLAKALGAEAELADLGEPGTPG